ncbi:MAG: serine hydrolase [Clostridia bacterium]|nr:serine hydrolase [Clostridia bacterium]
MKKLLFVLSALLISVSVLGSCAWKQSEQEDQIERLDIEVLAANIDMVAQYDLSQNKVFGSAYCVYQDGVTYEKCYGTTALDGQNEVTNASIFRLASMSKPITTVAALILVDRGLLSLSAPISKYIPDFAGIKIKDARGRTTNVINAPTVWNILTHTSGIGSDAKKTDRMTANDKKTLDDSIAFYVRSGLDFEPGSMQMYSGTGSFDVLSKIVEIVSEKTLAEFLKDEIFDPCGMTDTTFVPTAEQRKRMVTMHNRVDGENAEFAIPEGYIFGDYPETHYLGGAGLVSTLSDYAKFALMLLNKGKVGNKTILTEKTFNQLCTAQVDSDIMPGQYRWGLGVRVITDDMYPTLPVGSFGWSGAYGTHFWVDPVNKIFAVFMKNSVVDGGAGNESALSFENAVYDSFED